MARKAMTAADVHASFLLNGNASAGDILSWKRHHLGVTLVQLARADGHWSVQDVGRVEAARRPGGADVARYLRALERCRAG